MSTSPAAATPIRGVIALIASIGGASLMTWSFFTGIDAALNGAGSGPLVYEILFIVGAVLVVAALVLAIVHLVRGHSRLLAVLTIVASVIPLAVVIILALTANATP